jgi:hypothetical protein
MTPFVAGQLSFFAARSDAHSDSDEEQEEILRQTPYQRNAKGRRNRSGPCHQSETKGVSRRKRRGRAEN